jgi:hypothetical protein
MMEGRKYVYLPALLDVMGIADLLDARLELEPSFGLVSAATVSSWRLLRRFVDLSWLLEFGFVELGLFGFKWRCLTRGLLRPFPRGSFGLELRLGLDEPWDRWYTHRQLHLSWGLGTQTLGY